MKMVLLDESGFFLDESCKHPYAISFCGKGFHSSTAAGVKSVCVRTAVLQNGMYKNGEEYDLAVSQDPLVVKRWFKNHELCARNRSSVRMTCL